MAQRAHHLGVKLSCTVMPCLYYESMLHETALATQKPIYWLAFKAVGIVGALGKGAHYTTAISLSYIYTLSKTGTSCPLSLLACCSYQSFDFYTQSGQKSDFLSG